MDFPNHGLSYFYDLRNCGLSPEDMAENFKQHGATLEDVLRIACDIDDQAQSEEKENALRD